MAVMVQLRKINALLFEFIAYKTRRKNILVKLSQNRHYSVRRAVAQNSYTPVGILVKCSSDFRKFVRLAVAENPRTPIGTLRKLAKDSEFVVRAGVAKNCNCPTDILEELAKDSHSIVINEIAGNPNSPYHYLNEILMENLHNPTICEKLASNPTSTPDMLRILSKHSDRMVRFRVTRNLNTPIDVIDELAHDPDYAVCEEAIQTLSLV